MARTRESPVTVWLIHARPSTAVAYFAPLSYKVSDASMVLPGESRGVLAPHLPAFTRRPPELMARRSEEDRSDFLNA